MCQSLEYQDLPVDNVLRVLKQDNPELSITTDNMEQLRSAIRKINSVNYEIENTSGEIIKEIVDKLINN